MHRQNFSPCEGICFWTAERRLCFVACLYITDEKAWREGLGTTMLGNLIAELREKGIKAIETFARKDLANNPSGPIELCLKLGFKIKTDRNDFPLVRLELEHNC